jgi:hypothetical protein
MRADDDDTIVHRANGVYFATFLSVRTTVPVAVPMRVTARTT